MCLAHALGSGHDILLEALGLKPNHLIKMECAVLKHIGNHYYLTCPEPNRTMGTTEPNADFFIILLQDQTGGLQVHFQNQWANITPVN